MKLTIHMALSASGLQAVHEDEYEIDMPSGLVDNTDALKAWLLNSNNGTAVLMAVIDRWRWRAHAAEREAGKLRCALDTAYGLALWAASIRWDGEENTPEWLAELRDKIIACQQACLECGIAPSGMRVEDRSR